MDVEPVRSAKQAADAAALMRGIYEANKALYHDDIATIQDYYRGAWFFDDAPRIPDEYCPPHGDVLIAYQAGRPAGTVAIYRMDGSHCELKSMFVPEEFRHQGIAVALCGAVIKQARAQ